MKLNTNKNIPVAFVIIVSIILIFIFFICEPETKEINNNHRILVSHTDISGKTAGIRNNDREGILIYEDECNEIINILGDHWIRSENNLDKNSLSGLEYTRISSNWTDEYIIVYNESDSIAYRISTDQGYITDYTNVYEVEADKIYEIVKSAIDRDEWADAVGIYYVY